jgi:hypothetical protein
MDRNQPKAESMNTYRLKGASGKVAGQTQPLGALTRIGRGSGCELQVEDTLMPDLLAEISIEGDGGLRLVKRAASGEILLNGKPVNDARLRSGDEIRIGQSRWVLQAPGLRPEKVLTEKATRRGPGMWPWLVAAGVLGAAAAWAYAQGWLAFLTPSP